MLTFRGCVQQRCSPYCVGSFTGYVEPERLARAPVCSAKKKKRQDPSKQGKKKKAPERDTLALPPDTASLHLEYANLLGMDPRVAIKRVVEEGLPLDDDFVMALRQTRQAAKDNLTAARMMASNSEGIYSDDDMRSTMEESVEEAKAMLKTTNDVLRQLERPEDYPQERPLLALQRKIQPRERPAYTEGVPLPDLDVDQLLGIAPSQETSSKKQKKKKKKLDLYQEMDAMLDSIRDGTFNSEDKPKRPQSSAAKPKKPELSLAARPELYSSEEEESAEMPTMADYEELLAKGPRSRETVSDPQPQAAKLPPTPPPPLSARPSMATAAATRVAEEEKERKEKQSEMDRETRAVELEEKLFPRQGANDEFLQMDTVAVARERLQMQKEAGAEERSSELEVPAPSKPKAATPPRGSISLLSVEQPKAVDTTPEVLEPLKGPPQKAKVPSESTLRDDVIQEALGVPDFIKQKGQKKPTREKKAAAVKVSKAVFAGKEKVAGKVLSEMRDKVSKPVPKAVTVAPAAYFQTKGREGNPAGSTLPDLRDTLILLEEEDPNRLQDVDNVVKKPERKAEEVKAQTRADLPRPTNANGITDFKVPAGPTGERRMRPADVKPGARPVATTTDLPWASKYGEKRRVVKQGTISGQKPQVVEVEALGIERPAKTKPTVKFSAGPASIVRDASVLCTKKERITACTTMVCGAEGAVVKYASSQGAVGLLPFALMSAHTIAKVSEAVAKVLSDEQKGDEDGISEDDLLSQLEHMGSIPFLQPVNVLVHSVTGVRPAEPGSPSSIFRIQGFNTSPNNRQERQKQDTVILLSEVAAYDLKQLDVLAPKSADLDPLAAEIVLLSESLILEAKPTKEDWRGGSNVVSFVVPDLPLLNKTKALMSTEYSQAPTLKGVVMQSDADKKRLSGILSERKVSELGLETVSVEVVKGAPVNDGCIPLRWRLSDQDVLACKLVPATGNSESISLTACPDEIQRYLQQVAQCKSIHTIALGEVKVVQEPCTDSIQMFLSKSENEAEGDKGLMEHSVAVYSGNLVVAIKLQSTMQRAELDAALRELIC